MQYTFTLLLTCIATRWHCLTVIVNVNTRLETEVTWEGTFSQFKLLLLDHEWLCSRYCFIVVTSSVCSLHLLCLMETNYSMDRRNGKAFSSHGHIKLSETCIEKQFITCQNSPLWWPLMAHNIKSSLNVQLRLISGWYGALNVYFFSFLEGEGVVLCLFS